MPRVHLYWTRFGLPISIALAFVVVALLGVITFRNTIALRDGEREVAKSHKIGEATHRMLSALKDMQTGERGYLITGKRNFLEPFEEGKQELEESWREFDRLTFSREQKEQIVSLKNLVERKVAYLASAIEIRSRNPSARISDEIIDIVNSEGGERLMDSVRKSANAILELQVDRLSINERRSNELSSTSYRAILLGNLIALAFITLSGGISYIDRRKRDESESSLAAKESELSAIFNATSDGILTFDDHLKVRLMNPNARRLLGVSLNHEYACQLDEMVEVHGGSRAEIEAFVRSNLVFREFHGHACPLTGKTFPIEGRITKIESDGKKYNVLLFQDVTEIHRAESNRRELAAILDQLSDAIVVCDMSGFIVSWNRGAVSLYGISSDQAIGGNARELMCGSSLQTWDSGTRQLQSRSTFSTVFELTTSQSQKLWIEHRRSLIRDGSGVPVRQLVMHIDISERKIEEVRQRRSQRLESIGTLAGGVAHDLNNILTPILMNAKLAQRPGVDQKRMLDVIVTSAERGGKMIRKLLDFAGGERASLERVRVESVVNEVQEILRHTLPKTIVLKTELANDLSPIRVDPTELAQVLVNLAINAKDAMPDGGVITIEASNDQADENKVWSTDASNVLNQADHYVLLKVTDCGHGIPEEIQERIFDPFFTTKPQGKGTGLGLATSLGIVRSYGGDITVQSEVGKGSVFSVWLPKDHAQDVSSSTQPIDEKEVQGLGEMVLVVDDELSILESVKALLEQNGYLVKVAQGGKDAISIFLQSPSEIDVVVLDMMMPEVDGIETKRKLRSINPSIKIIGSSGLRRPQVDAGLNDLNAFLQKPYSNHELLQIVRGTLDTNTTKE